MNTQQNTNSNPTPELEILALQEDFPNKIVSYYYNGLVKEIETLSNNLELSTREKFIAIVKISDNYHTAYGQNMMSHLNFNDLDLSIYEINNFKNWYPFPYRSKHE